MDTITRKIKGQQREYSVYSQDEADAASMAYKHWKEAQEGDWALSDDGYVARCLSSKAYPSRSGKPTVYVLLSFGAQWATPTARLEFLPHWAAQSFSGTNTKSWDEREVRRTRTRNAVKVYVQHVMVGKIDWDLVGKVYRPDQRTPAATVRRLFKAESVKRFIDKEMERVLARQDVNADKVVRMLQRAYKVAKANRDPKGMLKVTDRFAVMRGMLPARPR